MKLFTSVCFYTEIRKQLYNNATQSNELANISELLTQVII